MILSLFISSIDKCHKHMYNRTLQLVCFELEPIENTPKIGQIDMVEG